MIFNKLLAILVSVAALLVENCCHAKLGYSSVNHLLKQLEAESESGSLPVEEYFTVLKEKLNSLEELSLFARTKNFFFISALRQVIQLEPLFNEPECRLEETKIISDIGGSVYLSDTKVAKLTPLDWLIHVVRTKHADECLPKYAEILTEIKAELGDDVIKAVSFRQEELGQERLERDISSYIKYLKSYKAFFGFPYKNLDPAIKNMVALSANEPQPHVCEFVRMIHKYLWRPCEEFVVKVSGLKDMVREDIGMFEDTTWTPLEDERLIELYEAFVYEQECTIMLENFPKYKHMGCIRYSFFHKLDICPKYDCKSLRP